MLIVGAGQHGFVPAERGSALEGLWGELESALAGRARDGRFQLIAGAGTDLPRTHSDVVASAIRDVVTRSEPKADEGISSSAIIAVLGILVALLGVVVTYRLSKPGAVYNEMQIARERAKAEKERSPGKPVADRAVKLVRSANEKAAHVYRAQMQGATPDPEAEAMWAKTWPEDDWKAQRAWIEPYDTGPGRAESLVQDVLTRLRGDERRVWVTAPAGSGKSTFMNRLFFEAIGVAGPARAPEAGSRALPVPMFVQPRNVGAQQIQRLRDAPDAFPLFLEGWLRNRAIDVAADSKDGLIADFTHAIEQGEIVLLIDGFDELVDLELAPFLRDLLGRAPYWVCAERSDRRLSRTGTSVPLPPTWSLAQIKLHLDARWPDRPAWSPRVLRASPKGDRRRPHPAGSAVSRPLPAPAGGEPEAAGRGEAPRALPRRSRARGRHRGARARPVAGGAGRERARYQCAALPCRRRARAPGRLRAAEAGSR